MVRDMFDSGNLRLLRPIIRLERLPTLPQHRRGFRPYSIHAQTSPSPRCLHYRPRAGLLRTSNWQQSRSLSLFGWGSSKPSDPDFSKAHSDSQPEISSSPTPIKAVHDTSDTPATSDFPHTPEPKALHDLENAIATPHSSSGSEAIPSEVELSSVPEAIGYLKDVCGLDYGWGPAATMQFLTEHIHIYGGLPWAGSIISVAVIIRLLVFKFAMNASNTGIKMKQMMPVLKPLQEASRTATEQKDQVKLLQLRTQMGALKKEYNVNFSTMFLPILIQIPLSFGAFRLFRGMASLPVPALEVENWLWTSNLTQGDPTYILPIVSGACLYYSLKLGAEGASPMQGQLAQTLRVFLPLTSFGFIYFQPGAVQLFFCTGSILSLVQSVLIRNAQLRRWMGLLPMTPNVTPAAGAIMPGGLRTYNVVGAEQEAPRNASIIDRFVDSAKERKEAAMGGLKGAKETVFGRAEDRKEKMRKDSMLKKAEAYEASRRRETEWERESRNKGKTTAGLNGRSGRSMADEEDDDRARATSSRGGRRRR